MKQFLLVLTALLVAAGLALAMTFRARTLDVPPEFSFAIPAASPPASFTLSVMHTGRMHSRAALAYRGGSFGDERVFGMAAVVLQHPKGTLLVDAGFGRNVDAHVLTTPFLMRALSKYDKEPSAAEQLHAAGLSPRDLMGVILTHAHWDHVSGVEDLAGTPVWVTQAERDFIRGCSEPVALACSFGELPYHVYGVPDRPFLGFGASNDVFGDGSVVLVPMPGHTPGSVAVFVTLASGKRYAFIGDTAWQKEGVDLPAERPWLPRTLLREDAASVRRWLVHLNQLQQSIPGLVIVPAHDRRILETLPTFNSQARTHS